MTSAGTARSYLYVPADRPERFDRSLQRGADAVIFDLEDGVAPQDKDAARAAAAAWISTQPSETASEIWVRVNTDSAADDVEAVAGPALTGVVLPKAEPSGLVALDSVLASAERRHGLTAGRLYVLPLIESALGLMRADDVAAAPRVLRVGVGEVDLAADLGMRPGTELTMLRLQVVVASAAVGIARPVAPTSTDFRDLEAFRATTADALRLGFRARTSIHPDQVAVVNDVFTPEAQELARAQDLLARSEAARGSVTVDAAGRMVDAAVLREAHEVLARAGEGSRS